MSNEGKQKIYEVGTYEPYEGGFHAFYRTLDENKALKILEVAENCHSRLPTYEPSADFEVYISAKLAIDAELRSHTGNGFNISCRSGDLYTIQMREVVLDN